MCLTRLPEGVNSTIPRNALRKNASGVAMRMKIRQSKTPQLTLSSVLPLVRFRHNYAIAFCRSTHCQFNESVHRKGKLATIINKMP